MQRTSGQGFASDDNLRIVLNTWAEDNGYGSDPLISLYINDVLSAEYPYYRTNNNDPKWNWATDIIVVKLGDIVKYSLDDYDRYEGNRRQFVGDLSFKLPTNPYYWNASTFGLRGQYGNSITSSLSKGGSCKYKIQFYASTCDEGEYVTAQGYCKKCEPGSFCPNGINRAPCDAGTYQVLEGATSCTSCPKGKYQQSRGQTSCFKSPGSLTYKERFRDGAGGVDGLDGACSVAVSTDGNNVYVVSMYDDAVAVFSRDADDEGKLSFVQVLKDGVNGVHGLDGARSISISPDGDNVYIASEGDDALVVFTRNHMNSGRLNFIQAIEDGDGSVDGLDNAYSITVSPDGANIYVASESDNAVAVFSRDTSNNGRVAFIQVIEDGDGPVDGLDDAYAVAVSPDGANVYVASESDDAVAVFSRNAGNRGRLSFVQVIEDGQGSVDGLDDAYSVTVSPDGANVYVVSDSDDAIAVFYRNKDNKGRLSFVQVLKDGVGGVDGLGDAHSVVVSPDGVNVYVASESDNAVTVFSRNIDDKGKLSFLQILKNINGLNGATSVTISPDGTNVYVASRFDDSLVVFSRNLPAPPTDAPTETPTNAPTRLPVPCQRKCLQRLQRKCLQRLQLYRLRTRLRRHQQMLPW